MGRLSTTDGTYLPTYLGRSGVQHCHISRGKGNTTKNVMYLNYCSALWQSEIHSQSWQIILSHYVRLPSFGPCQAHSLQWRASGLYQSP